MAERVHRRGKTRSIPEVSVPKSKGDATRLLREIGSLQRHIDRTESNLNEEIERLKAAAEKELGRLGDKVTERANALYTYSEAHRGELTDLGRTKTVHFATGVVSWRTSPFRVEIEDEEEVLERIKKLNLTNFIRIKEEINKTAMLADREKAETIDGVSFERSELFVVQPSRSVRTITKILKRKIPK